MRKWIIIVLFALPGNVVFAQNDFDQMLANYWKTAKPQKINVDLDKPFYMAGDDVFYHLNVQYTGLKPSEEIIYLALSDAEGTIVWQEKNQVWNGVAKGSFSLPDNLPQGNYLLYAYSRYLQNFSTRLFFKKVIPVLSISDDITEADDFDLKFFTADQHLVAGVNNPLTWVTNQPDTAKIRVFIYEGESLLQSVEENSFQFTPKTDQQYFAKVIYQGDTLDKNFDLPPVKEGAIIQLIESGDEFNLQIQKTPGYDPGPTTLFLADWNSVIYEEQIDWTNRNDWRVILTLDEFSTGINYVALSGQSGLVTQRLLFRQPVKRFTNSRLKSTYDFQEKVNSDLNFSKGLKGNLTISIHHLQHQDNPLSAFAADLEPKNYSFTPDASMDPQMQLLAYQWKWWQWTTLRKQNFTAPAIEHERGLQISGQVNQEEKGIMVSLSVPSGNPVFMYTQTDETGKFYFSNLNFTGTRDFYLKTWGEESYEIQLDDFSEEISLPAIQLPVLFPDAAMLQYKEQKILMEKTKNTFSRYQQFKNNSQDTHPANFNDIVIDYDDYYKLDEYFSFPNMEDVMREIVLGVILRDRKSGYKIRILDRRTKYYFKKQPLILLDGIPVAPEDIMDLNPTEVYGIAVTRPTGNFYDFGSLGKYGVLVVFTRQREYRPSAGASLVRGEIEGYGDRNRYEPVQKPDKNMPDFRPLLHWQTTEISALQEKLPLDFYTSHDQAEYQIIISGFTDDGERIYETFNFDVN